MPDILASAGDDCRIKVINYKTNEILELAGHQNYIRSLAWNHEIPGMLLSGSWDASIRIWDIGLKTCLHISKEHSSDIYQITSHPERPFIYVTVSRDSSIRIWHLGTLLEKPMVQPPARD